MYETFTKVLTPYVSQAKLFKILFNLSPMYRRSTGRISSVSEDLHEVVIKIPLSYKNRNYVGTIFGGSLFAATDPIYMIQLIQILGKSYVVWDKETTIRFKRPASEMAYATFSFSQEEIAQLKKEVQEKKQIDLVKNLQITNREQKVFVELEKTLFISDKEYYKQRRKGTNS